MLEEILSEKFPNFVRLPPRDPRSSTNFKHKKHKKKEPRKVIIKLPKISDKEKNLKILKIEKMYTRETKIRLTDFLLVLMQVRRQWKNIFKMLKKKKNLVLFQYCKYSQTEKVYYEQTCTTNNVKRIPLSRRKIPNGNKEH